MIACMHAMHHHPGLWTPGSGAAVLLQALSPCSADREARLDALCGNACAMPGELGGAVRSRAVQLLLRAQKRAAQKAQGQ